MHRGWLWLQVGSQANISLFFFFLKVRVEKVSNLIELEESSKFSLETSNHEFSEQ